MKTIKYGSVPLLFFYLALSSAAAPQCRKTNIADIKSIFAIAPSPVGNDLLFYGSTAQAEGELVTGKLFRLRLNGDLSEQIKAPDASNPPPPVWKEDGTSAYFNTGEGIYRLNAADGVSELLWKGLFQGLAISPNDHLLAFWRVEKGTDTLRVYDLKKRSQVRTWIVPDRFEGDKSGWDLAFSQEGQLLYARTYDQTNTTPLKRFDIRTGKVKIVNHNSYAVVANKEAVYFIAASGATRSLHKIAVVTGQPSLLVKNFDYDDLSMGGSPRWVLSQDYRSKRMAIIDTQTDIIKPIGKHESATVLSNGLLFRVNGAEIAIGDLSCKFDNR